MIVDDAAQQPVSPSDEMLKDVAYQGLDMEALLNYLQTPVAEAAEVGIDNMEDANGVDRLSLDIGQTANIVTDFEPRAKGEQAQWVPIQQQHVNDVVKNVVGVDKDGQTSGVVEWIVAMSELTAYAYQIQEDAELPNDPQFIACLRQGELGLDGHYATVADAMGALLHTVHRIVQTASPSAPLPPSILIQALAFTQQVKGVTTLILGACNKGDHDASSMQRMSDAILLAVQHAEHIHRLLNEFGNQDGKKRYREWWRSFDSVERQVILTMAWFCNLKMWSWVANGLTTASAAVFSWIGSAAQAGWRRLQDGLMSLMGVLASWGEHMLTPQVLSKIPSHVITVCISILPFITKKFMRAAMELAPSWLLRINASVLGWLTQRGALVLDRTQSCLRRAVASVESMLNWIAAAISKSRGGSVLVWLVKKMAWAGTLALSSISKLVGAVARRAGAELQDAVVEYAESLQSNDVASSLRHASVAEIMAQKSSSGKDVLSTPAAALASSNAIFIRDPKKRASFSQAVNTIGRSWWNNIKGFMGSAWGSVAALARKLSPMDLVRVLVSTMALKAIMALFPMMAALPMVSIFATLFVGVYIVSRAMRKGLVFVATSGRALLMTVKRNVHTAVRRRVFQCVSTAGRCVPVSLHMASQNPQLPAYETEEECRAACDRENGNSLEGLRALLQDGAPPKDLAMEPRAHRLAQALQKRAAKRHRLDDVPWHAGTKGKDGVERSLLGGKHDQKKNWG
jgi:hypothetical protein